MNNQKDFLYKYKAIDPENIDRASRIFTHNEIYFAKVSDFNDPFDCRFDYSFDASVEDLKKYLRRVLKIKKESWNRQRREKWIAEHRKIITQKDSEFNKKLKLGNEGLLSGIGICSLSTLPDNILMWSHYANCHKGFCLKFLDDENDQFIARAQEVSYSKEYPIVNPVKDDDMVRLKKALLTKANNWKYEKEWRIIDHETGPGIKYFPSHILAGVIFGCRMTEADQVQIREWCKSRATKISFYKARQEKQSFSLEIIEV